jgi:chemotaxis signal transduction protein
VVGGATPEFGILSDAVEGIASMDPTRTHPLPGDRGAEAAQLLRGVTHDAVHVLDAAALIARQSDSPGRPPPMAPPLLTTSS